MINVVKVLNLAHINDVIVNRGDFCKSSDAFVILRPKLDDDLSVAILACVTIQACRVTILACRMKLIHCACGAPKERELSKQLERAFILKLDTNNIYIKSSFFERCSLSC
jgi:hypothetical protein